MTEAFILGLSSGSACLVTCGMVMFPYMMAGSAGVKRIARNLFLFVSFLFISVFSAGTIINSLQSLLNFMFKH